MCRRNSSEMRRCSGGGSEEPKSFRASVTGRELKGETRAGPCCTLPRRRPVAASKTSSLQLSSTIA